MFKTFSDFAKDKSSLENIANQFGYDFLRCILEFNNKELTEEQLADAKRLEKETILSLQVANPTNEQIKREALIFPVIKQLILWTKIAKLECEYPLTANLDEIQLNGSLDYLIWGKKNLIVIEAKNDDFVGGAKQLIAEIVAIIFAIPGFVFDVIKNVVIPKSRRPATTTTIV